MKTVDVLAVGPSNSGKSYNFRALSDINYFSTGNYFDSLAAGNSFLALRIKKRIEAGELISDDIVFEIIQSETFHLTNKPFMVFDGFPRTIVQAEKYLKCNRNNPIIAHFDAPWEVCIERSKLRRVCINQSCKRTQLANEKEKCIFCGANIIPRKDDENIELKLEKYFSETEPVIKFLSDYYPVLGLEIKLMELYVLEKLKEGLLTHYGNKTLIM